MQFVKGAGLLLLGLLLAFPAAAQNLIWQRQSLPKVFCGVKTKHTLIALNVKHTKRAMRKLEKLFDRARAKPRPEKCGGNWSLGALKPGESSESVMRLVPVEAFGSLQADILELGELRYLSGEGSFGNADPHTLDAYEALESESKQFSETLAETPWTQALLQDELSRLRPRAGAIRGSSAVQALTVQLIEAGKLKDQVKTPKSLRQACKVSRVKCRGEIPEILEELYSVGTVPTAEELHGWFFGLEYNKARSAQPLGRALMIGEDDMTDPKFIGGLHISLVGAIGVPESPPFRPFVTKLRKGVHTYFNPPVFESDRVLLSNETTGVQGRKTIPIVREFGLRKLGPDLFVVKQLSWPGYFLFYSREFK